MSIYRYVSTNLLTGQVLADNVPVVITSASRFINGAIGQLSGYLPLQQNGKSNSAFVNALTPRKTVLWILQDGFPIGGWRITDTPHQSILSNQLPIVGQTIEQLFTKRHILGALTYTNTDLFEIGRGLVTYGMSAVQGPNAQVAGLNLLPGLSGVTDTLTFGVSNSLTAGGNTYTGTYSDNQPVLDAYVSTAAADNFEFSFEPALAGSSYGWNLRQGYPAIGQYNTPRQVLVFPGNVIDYGRPIMGSNGANIVIATSAANGTGQTFTNQAPHGVDNADLAAGYPAEQVVVSWPGAGVTSQAQINSYADLMLGQYTAGTMVPAVTVGGGTEPLLRELGLGDAIYFSATSDLDAADPVTAAPGLQMQARITGWKLYPPSDQQAEKVDLALGALVGQVSTGTVS